MGFTTLVVIENQLVSFGFLLWVFRGTMSSKPGRTLLQRLESSLVPDHWFGGLTNIAEDVEVLPPQRGPADLSFRPGKSSDDLRRIQKLKEPGETCRHVFEATCSRLCYDLSRNDIHLSAWRPKLFQTLAFHLPPL